MFSVDSKRSSRWDRIFSRAIGRPSIGHSNARSGRHRSLRCEPLEDRRLLSVYSDLFKAPELVEDINTDTADAIQIGAGGQRSVVIGDTLYFAADDGNHGVELWKTDGTEAGTFLVKDMVEGAASSLPMYLTNVGETLYLTTGATGEVWRGDVDPLDGKMTMTQLNANTDLYRAWGLTAVDTTVYFCGASSSGIELWKASDGSNAAVRAIVGTQQLRPESLASVSVPPDSTPTLYFYAGLGYDWGIWKINQASEAVHVTAVRSGYYPEDIYLTEFGGSLFFRAPISGTDYELCKLTPTADGGHEKQFFDITPGSVGSRPSGLRSVDGTLYFTISDDTLWKYYAGNVSPVTNLGPYNRGTYDLTVFDGYLFFPAWDSQTGSHELWRTGGGTSDCISHSLPGSNHSVSSLIVANGGLYFSASDGAERHLWRIQSSHSPAEMVAQIGTSSYADVNVNINGTLMYNANDGIHGVELWRCPSPWGYGASLIKDINAGTLDALANRYGSIPYSYGQPVDVNGVLYFVVGEGDSKGLWRSDGTEAGTEPVKTGISPSGLTKVGSTLYFVAADAEHGRELWKSDAEGTAVALDIVPGPGSGNPGGLCAVGNSLVFSLPQPMSSGSLWKRDEGASSAQQITGVPMNFNNLTVVEERDQNRAVYFSGSNNTLGVWRINLATATAERVAEDVLEARSFIGIGDCVYFQGYDATRGWELWWYKPSTGEHDILRDINPSGDSSPSELTNVAGALYFTAYDPDHGRELWASNGTELGTNVIDLNPGTGSTGIRYLASAGGILYFTNWAAANGCDLWACTPGKDPIGLKDINASDWPFYYSQWPGSSERFSPEFTDVNGTLFFCANDGVNGVELWTSDGTGNGTKMVTPELYPGLVEPHDEFDVYPVIPASAFPLALTVSNGNLFFAADDGKHGFELWKVEGNKPPVAAADSYKVAQDATLTIDHVAPWGGKVTTSFGTESYGLAAAIDNQGRILAAGGVVVSSTNDDFALARYQAESGPFTGTLDAAFGTGGKTTTHIPSTGSYDCEWIEDLLVLPDGKILAAGSSMITDAEGEVFVLLRYNSDGTLDTEFGENDPSNPGHRKGYVTTDFDGPYAWGNALAVHADGKIVVAGTIRSAGDSDFGLAQYNADGTPDTSFDQDGKLTTDLGSTEDGVFGVLIQDDDKILVAGSTWKTAGPQAVVVRYDASGTRDGSFGDNGVLTVGFAETDVASVLAGLENGDFLVAGYATNGSRVGLARFHANGSPDTGFGTGGSGKVTTDFGLASQAVYSIAVQADGKIVAAGTGAGDYLVARYNSYGSLDDTFGSDGHVLIDFAGAYDCGNAVAIQPDGKIVIAGEANWAGNTGFDFGVVRLNKDGTLDTAPGGVLGNDSDPNGDPLTAVLVSSPAHGSLALSQNGTFTYTPSANYVGYDTFTYKAWDGSAGFESAPTTVTIAVGTLLAHPGGPYVIAQGEALKLDASASCDLEGDPLTFAWDLDGDADYNDATGKNPTLAWNDLAAWNINSGTYTVSVRVSDSQNVRDASTTLTVTNVAPVVEAGLGGAINEGGTFTGSGSFADPGRDTWTATVDYRDGGGPVPLTLNADKTFSLSHLYRNDGLYTVTVTVSDGHTSQSDTLEVAVNNVAPVLSALADTPASPSGESLTLSRTVAFEDPGSDTWTATVDYGDGSISEPLTVGKSFSLSHPYSVGVYQVSVTIDDGDGGQVSDTFVYAAACPVVATNNVIGDAVFVVEEEFVGGESRLYAYHDTNSNRIMEESERDSSDTYYALLANVHGILIQGSSVSEDFVVKVDNLPTPPLFTGVFIVAGEGVGDNDDLVLVGAGQVTLWEHVSGVTPESGEIKIDGLEVHYAEFEPIYDNLNVAQRKFVMGKSGGQNIVVDDFGVSGDGKSMLHDGGTGAFETIIFTNPTASMSIDAGDGDDQITIGALGSAWTAALEAAGGDGADSIDASACSVDVTLDGGPGADELVGGSGDDVLLGGSGDDVLVAGAGVNTVAGGEGVNAVASNAGGAVSLNEGDTFTLSLSGLVPGGANVAIAWGDGATTTGAILSASHVYADEGSYQVTVSSSGAAVPSTTVTVANVAPTVQLISGPSAGVPGQALSFESGFVDPGKADVVALTWEVRNAAGTVVATGQGTQFTFTPAVAGSYQMSFAANDGDGGVSTTTKSLVASALQLEPNPSDGSLLDLLVSGTAGKDQIVISPGATPGDVLVTLNGAVVGSFRPTGRILTFGLDGDDDLQIAGSVAVPAWLYGGAGNDRLKGGAASDLLFGEDGDDLLVGNQGRDFLVGGQGTDRIVGNADDDILISGLTDYDHNDAALRAIMAEWTSDRSFQKRTQSLCSMALGEDFRNRSNGNYFLIAGRTTHDDGAYDVLTGCEGLDWFFANLVLDANDDATRKDKITDLSATEFAVDLDWIMATLP